MGHLIRLELIREGLLVLLANHYLVLFSFCGPVVVLIR